MALTPSQIRAARALLRWSATELAEKSGVSLPTIQRIEAAEGTPNTRVSTLEAIVAALEDAGVIFIAENGGGAGVRFAAPRVTKKKMRRP